MHARPSEEGHGHSGVAQNSPPCRPSLLKLEPILLSQITGSFSKDPLPLPVSPNPSLGLCFFIGCLGFTGTIQGPPGLKLTPWLAHGSLRAGVGRSLLRAHNCGGKSGFGGWDSRLTLPVFFQPEVSGRTSDSQKDFLLELGHIRYPDISGILWKKQASHQPAKNYPFQLALHTSSMFSCAFYLCWYPQLGKRPDPNLATESNTWFGSQVCSPLTGWPGAGGSWMASLTHLVVSWSAWLSPHVISFRPLFLF